MRIPGHASDVALDAVKVTTKIPDRPGLVHQQVVGFDSANPFALASADVEFGIRRQSGHVTDVSTTMDDGAGYLDVSPTHATALLRSVEDLMSQGGASSSRIYFGRPLPEGSQAVVSATFRNADGSAPDPDVAYHWVAPDVSRPTGAVGAVVRGIEELAPRGELAMTATFDAEHARVAAEYRGTPIPSTRPVGS